MRTAALAPERLWTGLDEPARRGWVVVVGDDRIQEIVPRDRLPRGVAVEELPGATLLPGLIDCHIHLDEWVPPLCLASGITTVRDTANHLDWILDLRRSAAEPGFPGPRVLCAGPALDGFPYVHPRITWGIRSADDAALAVRTLARRGVDAIKLYVGLDAPTVERLAAEAARVGLPTLGHFDTKVPLIDAVRLGVRETEHLAGVPDGFEPAVIDQILSRDAWVVPTQVVWEALLQAVDEPEVMADAMTRVPANVRGWWERFRDITLRDDPGLAKLRQFCRDHRRYLAALITGGARIAAGTDAPCQYVVPGRALIDELTVLVDCGMTRGQVLRAATARAAELLGIAGETGTIEPGKRADLLLVRGDPLSDLAALHAPVAVFRDGVRWDPARLLEDMHPERMPSDTFPDPFVQATEWEDWKAQYVAREDPWQATGPT